MSIFWIGGKERAASDRSVEVSTEACRQVAKSLGKDPGGASTSIPAAVAGNRLRKYDFPDAVVAEAGSVLRLIKGATAQGGKPAFGVVLRWRF